MKRWVRKWISALCLWLAVSPVFVLAGTIVQVGSTLGWLLLPALSVTLATLAGAFPAKTGRILAGIAGALLLAGCAYAAVPAVTAALAYAACLVLYWMVLKENSQPPFGERSMAFWIAGLVLHIVGMMVARGLEQVSLYPLLRGLMMAYVPVFFLSINHLAVLAGASARDGRRPPWRIQSGNIKLAVGVSVLVLILANLRVLRDAFYTAGNWLLSIIARAVDWFLNLFVSETAVEPEVIQEAAPEMMALPEASEPALLWVILEKIIEVVGTILIIALAAFVLYKLAGQLRKLYRHLQAKLREMARYLGEGAQDETESILDWEELRAAAEARIARVRKRLTPPPRWQDLDARGRIRLSFAQWKASHRIGPARTAREALRPVSDGERLAALYERARYSDLPLSEEDAEFMRDHIQQEK